MRGEDGEARSGLGRGQLPARRGHPTREGSRNPYCCGQAMNDVSPCVPDYCGQAMNHVSRCVPDYCSQAVNAVSPCVPDYCGQAVNDVRACLLRPGYERRVAHRRFVASPSGPPPPLSCSVAVASAPATGRRRLFHPPLPATHPCRSLPPAASPLRLAPAPLPPLPALALVACITRPTGTLARSLVAPPSAGSTSELCPPSLSSHFRPHTCA